MMAKTGQKGFTIVELLIVIVVIGILAAITIVAFNGIQNRANDTAVQSDLRQFGVAMSQYKALNDRYPAPADFNLSMGLKFTRGAYHYDTQSRNLRYCRNSTTDEFIMYAVSKSGSYFRFMSASGKVEPAASTFGHGICNQIGLTSVNPSPDAVSSSTVWANWVN